MSTVDWILLINYSFKSLAILSFHGCLNLHLLFLQIVLCPSLSHTPFCLLNDGSSSLSSSSEAPNSSERVNALFLPFLAFFWACTFYNFALSFFAFDAMTLDCPSTKLTLSGPINSIKFASSTNTGIFSVNLSFTAFLVIFSIRS